jgi:hypothetical protein
LTGAASDFDSKLKLKDTEGTIASTDRSTILFFKGCSPPEVLGAPVDKVKTEVVFIVSHFLFCLAAVIRSLSLGAVESRGGLWGTF